MAGEAAAVREEWSAKSGEFGQELHRQELGGGATQVADIVEAAETLRSDLDVRLRNGIRDAKGLLAELKELPEKIAKWHAKHAALVSSVPRLKKEADQQSATVDNIAARLDRFQSILHPRGTDETPVVDVHERELEDIRIRGMEAAGRSEMYRLTKVLTICDQELEKTADELNTARNQIEYIKTTVDELEKKLPAIAAPPPPPPAAEKAALETALEAHVREMVTTGLQLAGNVARFRRDAKKGSRKGLWAWIAGIFTDLIDSIMHANAPKAPQTAAIAATDEREIPSVQLSSRERQND